MTGLVTALAIALAACGKPSDVTKTASPQAEVGTNYVIFPKDSPQLATLRTIEALPEQESFVRINGRASWNDARTSRVSSPVAGRVVELPVMPGSSVRKGDVLAVVTSPEFGLIQAEARKAQADHQLAERSLERVRDLHAAGVVPTKELQNSEAELARSLAELQRTQVRQRGFGGGSKVDQLFKVVAPISGVLVDRRVTIGQEIRSDQAPESALFVISDPINLWISLDVPESLSQEVQVGEAVRVTVPALAGEVFDAHIEYVADFIDPQTRTVKARASVDNSKRRLKADMYVTSEVEMPVSKALKVPANALYLQGNRYHGFVEESPGRFVRKTMKAEPSGVGMMRVFTGIEKGDRVVVDGALLLQQMLNQKANTPPPRKDHKPS